MNIAETVLEKSNRSLDRAIIALMDGELLAKMGIDDEEGATDAYNTLRGVAARYEDWDEILERHGSHEIDVFDAGVIDDDESGISFKAADIIVWETEEDMDADEDNSLAIARYLVPHPYA